jgi:hypothetical protein
MDKPTEKEYKEMKEMFKIVGLANPEIYPESFKYQYKVYLIMKNGI